MGIYDMVPNVEEAMEEMKEQVFLYGKPSWRITTAEDGTKVLQVLVCFKMDPFSQFEVDSRFLKTIHARFQWAHLVDEVIKEPGEQIDLLALEGMQFNIRAEVDRKILEFISHQEELKQFLEQEMEINMFSPVLASALTFGSIDIIAKMRSVMEIFNQEIRDNLEQYNEFLEEYEDRRYVPAEMLDGLTEKIVTTYAMMEGPQQNIYKELKSEIAGPHSVQLCVPLVRSRFPLQAWVCCTNSSLQLKQS